MSSACAFIYRGTARKATPYRYSRTSFLMFSTVMYKEGLRIFLYTPSSMRIINWLSPRTLTGASRPASPSFYLLLSS
jgi:hypothetical protein